MKPATALTIFLIIAAAFLASSSSFVAAHCIFDSDVALQDGIKSDMAKPAPPNQVDESRRAAAWESIRITISTLDLDDSTKYCTAAGESKPDFKGSTMTCTADDVFSSTKKAKLVNDILPHAKGILQDALRVKRLTADLGVGSTSQCSGGFTIPASHVSPGISSTDYVLYVSAGPTVSGNVAWAGGCQSTVGSPSRIIVGRANFGPKYIASSSYPDVQLKATAVHEILHALGFAWSSFSDAGITSSGTFRGIAKNQITSATARQRARDYMSCTTLTGVELEDEGGSGSANSHVDRRLYKDDVMAAAGGFALSDITLAIMEGLGVYSANSSSGEAMVTGWQLGCKYADSACTTTDGGKGIVWCSVENEVGCASDFRGYGPCKTSSPLFTDNCGYVNPYSNKNCYDTTQTSSSQLGEAFHADSRCVVTTSFRSSGSGVDTSTKQRCMRAKCVNGVVSMGYDGTTYAACVNGEGSSITLAGYEGTITCPHITRFCQATKFYSNAGNAFGPLPPAQPVTLGKTNRASDFIYTVRSTLTITGTGWASLVEKYYNEIMVAIGLDCAQHLKLQQQQVWLRNVYVYKSLIQFVVTINDPTRTAAQIQAEWTSALDAGGRNWMPRTASLYEQHSATGDYAAMGAASTETKPSNLCTPYMPSMEDVHECNGMIAGLVFVVVTVIALIVMWCWCFCCRYLPPPSDWKYRVGPK